MNISVVIPTMNRVDSLKRTFHYLEQAKPAPDQIIIVDQTQDPVKASQIEEICKKSALNAEYTWNSVPSSTKARNSGCALAKGDIIVFMDDDVDVHSDTFSNILNIFHDEKVAMVGGVNELDPERKWTLQSILGGRTSYRKRYRGHVTLSMYGQFPASLKDNVETEWAMGFFFAVRKKLMDMWSIKFDEKLKYYAYAEDLDFSYSYYKNANREKLTCLFSPFLSVRHNVSKEYRIHHRKETYMAVLHRRYLGKKLRNGLSTMFFCLWSDFVDIIYRLIHHEDALDVFCAILFYYRYRKDVHEGNFHYEKFM